MDKDENGFLFSINTVLAFQIQRTYYNNIHYVWCAEKYNHGIYQPPSSNPLTIAQTLIQDVCARDAHSEAILRNRRGLKRGAVVKREAGIIDEETERKIITIVDFADFEKFLPLLYIIPKAKVKSICKKVPVEDRAAYHSVEYLISHLPRSAFELIDLGRTLPASLIGENNL